MTVRVLIVIPTYNNPKTVDQVVREALESTEQSVLVVDDGSHVPVLHLLTSPSCVEALAQDRLITLRLEQNCGKGRAIQESFQWALAHGYTHVLTIDGDGQHLLTEAKKLLNLVTERPWDLIIGKRHLDSVTVPRSSQFGRAFSNFWVGYQTGEQVCDSQSGYRLYPLFHVQGMRFWTSRYDFEIEVLIRLLWKGVNITEVEVDVHYPPPHERVSHFHKLRDNTRISILNTALVVLSLLRFQSQPRQFGWAMGMGVFVGCSPFFGFHALILAAVSFFTRLNFVVMFVGSQISFPPIAVFLIPLEIVVGRAVLLPLGWSAEPWLPDRLGFRELLGIATGHFGEWLSGAVLVGLMLGAFFGVLS